MIIEFILSALFGAVLHQTRRITEKMPDGWENISDHSVGGAGLLFLWPFWYWRLKSASGGFIRGWLSLAMTLLGFGAGVVFGWYWDGREKV